MDMGQARAYHSSMSAAPPPVRFLDRTTPPHILTLILMAGLGALSLNIFLPSLPTMAAHFGVDYALMQLTVSLYLAATAAIQVVIGPISDRFGRRPVVLVTTALFTLACLGTAFAPNFEIFLISRLAQASIATTVAMSRAVVRDMVPQDQAASMIGYVVMGMAVVPMIGPAIGGGLDQLFGWQASFVLMAAIGVGLCALVWADQGETAIRRQGGFRAQIAAYPALLGSQRFWGYCLASAFAAGTFFAYLGGAPFVGTNVFGMSTAELGFFFGAPAVGYMAGNGMSGRFSMRVGINRMMLAGALITLAGMSLLVVLILTRAPSLYSFFGMMIFVGLGNGILLPSANAGMLSVLAGMVLSDTSGPLPLVLLMVASSVVSLAMVGWVIRRARIVGA